jgi:copper chaperone CopZ
MKLKILFALACVVATITANAQFTKAKIQASGLTCAMCAKSIFKNLKTIPGVDSVDTDLNSSSFVLVFKSDAKIDPDVIRKKVEDAGFAIASLQLTGDFKDVAVKNDAHVTLDGKTYHFLKTTDQVLSGQKTITIVDKSFVTAKDFKKFSSATRMECIKTGTAEACCTREGVQEKSRVYHVTI